MIVDDIELLRRYGTNHDEDAFSELVSRNVDLVWSAAARACGDPDLAKDIAQEVFADLARKARLLSSSKKVVLAGWLYRAARHTSAKAIRGNVRRANRERQASMIQAMEAMPENEPPEIETILPVIDDALDHLKSADRDAVVLRFLRRKSLKEVGAELGISERAAQKRVLRALEKLRLRLGRRGIQAAGGALAAALTSAGGQAAPAGMAVTLSASSLASAGSAGAASGFLATLSQLKTQLILMKTKIAIATITTAVVVTPLAVQQSKLKELREQNQTLQMVAAQLPDLEAENHRLNQVRAAAEELERRRREEEELARLRAEVARLRQKNVEENVALQERLETARLAASRAKDEADYFEAPLKAETAQAKTTNFMKILGLTALNFAASHEDRLPTTFEEIEDEMPDNISGGRELDDFEYVEHAGPISTDDPTRLLFREKVPRQLPDGGWARAYAFTDGSVQNIVSEDGNFEDFESQYAPQPEPNP